MHARTKTRPYALFGAALVGAGAIVTAPAVVRPADRRHRCRCGTDRPGLAGCRCLDPRRLVDLRLPCRGAGLCRGTDRHHPVLRPNGRRVGWLAGPVPLLRRNLGAGDWVSDRYDMFEEILSPGWNPLTWIEGLLESISADPEVLFGPVADFDLGWLYSLLGVSAQDGEQLDSLLELASGYYGGQITLGLLTVYGTGPGRSTRLPTASSPSTTCSPSWAASSTCSTTWRRIDHHLVDGGGRDADRPDRVRLGRP